MRTDTFAVVVDSDQKPVTRDRLAARLHITVSDPTEAAMISGLENDLRRSVEMLTFIFTINNLVMRLLVAEVKTDNFRIPSSKSFGDS